MGTARRVRISLGEGASVEQILQKMRALFANTYDKNNIMQEFFNAHQLADETVTSFACRLEYILTNSTDFSTMSDTTRQEMLRCKFWTSLSSDSLKSQTRHKFDSVKNYQELIKEIRQVEHELSVSSVSSSASMKTSNKTDSSSRKASQNVLAADSASSDFDKRLSKLENRVDTQLSQLSNKLDEVLKSLSTRNDATNETQVLGSHYNESHQSSGRWRGNRRNNRGRGRGFNKFSNSNTQNSPNA